MAVKAESAPATVHVSVEVRRIHTPESRAESAFSDIALMLRPQLVERTASAKVTATIGATMRVSTSPGEKMVVPRVNDRSNGTGTGLYRLCGRMNGSAVNARRTWLRPMVATITRTRGRLNRRRSTSSDSAPTAAARPMERTSANQYSNLKSAVSLTRKTAAMTPTCPWAKLSTRLVR